VYGDIMKIEVLGTGCTTCNSAEAVVRKAVEKSGVEIEVIKVSDRKEIAKSGVLITPGIIVNGRLKLTGKIPSVEEVSDWIREAKS
jgi:small redox-active disulfide protein 2